MRIFSLYLYFCTFGEWLCPDDWYWLLLNILFIFVSLSKLLKCTYISWTCWSNADIKNIYFKINELLFIFNKCENRTSRVLSFIEDEDRQETYKYGITGVQSKFSPNSRYFIRPIVMELICITLLSIKLTNFSILFLNRSNVYFSPSLKSLSRTLRRYFLAYHILQNLHVHVLTQVLGLHSVLVWNTHEE